METHFEIQLGKLRTRLFKMCSLVDEQIQFALRAIEEEDLTLAESVIERDKKVDKYDVKGNQGKTILNLNFESALTFGDWDINENWLKYKQDFLKGLNNEELQ